METKPSGNKSKRYGLFVLLPFLAMMTLSFQNCGSQFELSEYAQKQAELGLPSTSEDPGTSGSSPNPSPSPSPSVTPTPSPPITPGPSPSPSPVPTVPPSSGTAQKFFRGINVMDLGIADNAVPGIYGTNYTKPSYAAMKALKDRGLTVLRMPFKWERVQRQLGGALDTAYLNLILEMLRDADTAQIKIILDMHNYGRYKIGGVTQTVFGQSNGPTLEQYADVWRRLTQAIRSDAKAYRAVYAYDIMNEPYSFPSGVRGLTPQKLWEEYAQAAVTAIRNSGETKLIHVEGYSWASADRWPGLHPKAWIKDPLNNIMYHAHMYMDNDASGTYTISHAQETANSKAKGYASIAARAIARVKNFSDWCAVNKVPCFLGEFGWPTAAKVGDSEAQLWNIEGEKVYQFMDSVKMGGTMWATGTWLGPAGNILNAYVLPSSSRTFQPLSQAPVLEKYLGNGTYND